MTNNHLNKLATKASILASIIIIIAKTIGWILTDSLSIFASLVDSFLDIAASLINFIALNYAIQPPDNEHRFGHGKAEDLAVFTQATFFGISGIFVLGAGIKRLFITETIEKGEVGIIIMIFSIFITLALVIFQNYVVKKTKSRIVEADSFHYLIDLFTNIASITGLILLTYFNFEFADTIFAILISIYIIWGAKKLLNKSFKNLMDHEFSDEEKKSIINIIKSQPKILGFHDLRTRYSGSKPFIQFHIELDPKTTILKAHEVVTKLEEKIKRTMPDVGLIIHQDPSGIDEEIEYQDE